MTVQVIAGRCTTVFEGSRERTQHGDALVVVKPDGTVLVHDAQGYQPLAWLTRAEAVTVTSETVTAQDGDQSLHVAIEETYAREQYPASDAGVPVGECPDCAGTLVRAQGRVSCPDCPDDYGLPSGTTVLSESCEDCGLPLCRVERGATLEVCLDPDCEPLDARVRDRFDGEWDCPNCDGALRVLRRGGLLLGCENYPDCATGFSFPAGNQVGECDCGLPVFETASGARCLDRECRRELPASITGP